jgi:WD40 repeat protein
LYSARDGQTLASGSRDQTIILWNLRNGARQLTIRGHQGAVNALTFSPDGRTLASASDDQTIKLWEVYSGTRKLTLQGHTQAVNMIVYTPDGQTLASASNDRTVRLWDISNGDVRQVLSQHKTPVGSLSHHSRWPNPNEWRGSDNFMGFKDIREINHPLGSCRINYSIDGESNGELLISASEDKPLKFGRYRLRINYASSCQAHWNYQ